MTGASVGDSAQVPFSTSFVSFSEKETAPKSVSHYYTKALSNRVIVHLSKSNRVRVQRVQHPSRPFLVVSGEDGEKGFRVRVPAAQGF